MQQNQRFDIIGLNIYVASYAFFIFYEPFGIPVVFNIFLWSLSLFFLLLKRKIKRMNIILVSIVCIVTLVIVNIRDIQYIVNGRYYLMAMLVSLLVLFLYRGDAEKILQHYDTLLIPAFIASVLVLMYKCIPSFYFSVIEPLLKPEHVLYNTQLIGENYSPSLGYAIGVTADCIVLGLFFCIGKIKCKFSHLHILFVIFILALIGLGRRGELLSFFISIIVLYFFSSTSRKKALILLGGFMGIILMLCVFILTKNLIINYEGVNRYVQTLSTLALNSDFSNGRLGLYNAAMGLFAQNLIFGIGWGSFAKAGSEILIMVTNVHNIYLQLFCETGILGAVTVLSLLGVVFFYTYIARKNLFNKKYIKDLNFSLLVQIYILCKGLVDNSIYYSNFWILYALAVLPVLQHYMDRKRGTD